MICINAKGDVDADTTQTALRRPDTWLGSCHAWWAKGDYAMKCFMLFTASGPLVILTSYGSATDPDLLKKLHAKGIDKFLAYDIPIAMARERYGAHFFVVEHDLNEDNDLRILDYNGERAFRLFHFNELAAPITYEIEP